MTTRTRIDDRLHALAAMLAVAAMTGCLDDFDGDLHFGPKGYEVWSYSGNVLTGDTARASSYGNSRWSVAGPAVMVRAATDTAPTTTVLLRAMAPGIALVTGVQACCGGATSTIQFRIADSSDVSLSFLPDTMTLKVDALRLLPLYLRDATGIEYRALITWTSSDAAVVGVRYDFAVAHTVGTAWLFATWATLRDSVRVVVTK